MTLLSTAPGRARVKGPASRVTLAGIAAAAVGAMLLQLRAVDLGTLATDMRVPWLLAAIAAAALSLVAAMHNLSAFAPIRLRFRDSIRAQLAICGIRVVTPSALSTPAICSRFLNRSGLEPAESLAVVGAAQVAQLVMTVVVVGALALVGSEGLSAPDPRSLSIVAGGLSLVVAVASLAARRVERLRSPLATARRALAQVIGHVHRRPVMAVSGLAASAALTLTHVAAFACCVAAVGGQVSLLTATAIYLGASGAGSLVPTPGGVGAVETAMIAGLAAAGTSVVTATAAALLVRLVMTWALVPPGLLALRSLRRGGLL
jgi:glycosyltransferase 2 family protein